MSCAPTPMVPGLTAAYPEVLASSSRDYGSGQVDPAFSDLYAEAL